jgi:release factor glutamine methyltransferase
MHLKPSGYTVPVTLTQSTFGPIEVTHDERVLTPRAWTLAQSEWAVELAADLPPGPILELCAGAGQIGLAAAVMTGRPLVLIEADPVAAGYCRTNAEAAGRSDSVEIRCEPLETAIRPHERWPLILADPPYLCTDDIGRFPEDPQRAIDGGRDGLYLISWCLAIASAHLLGGCPLLLQVAGPAQAKRAAELAVELGSGLLVPDGLRVIDDERAIVALRRIE